MKSSGNNALSSLFAALKSFGSKPDPLAIDTSGFETKVAPGSTIASTRAGGGAGGPMSLMDRLFGDAEGKTSGLAMPAIGAGLGVMNAYMGMKQFGLAKDSFKFEKEAFNKNFDAQRNMTNSSLSDRQHARVAANPGAHQDVASYMAKFGVK